MVASDFNLILDEVLYRKTKSLERHLKVTQVIKVWWETAITAVYSHFMCHCQSGR